ncbi:MAG: MFS transporter [Gammaproteobacteria bacterium]|nr:MFS transporter [Gammaproteobacteria bacterium]MBV8403125.1 MFS transporter [Gammaproteobacteria bacterium]
MHPPTGTRASDTRYLIFAAAAILLITMGARQSLGLFVAPINRATGTGIVAISFAMAIGQFVWGLAQPISGIAADRFGPGRVLIAGAVILAIGAALTTVVKSELGLVLTIGVLFAAGAAAGSFSVLIGATARNISPEKRAFASGFINAGGSMGQFLIAPLSQFIIAGFGWVTAMYSLAVAALATIPLARLLTSSSREHAGAPRGGAVTTDSGPSLLAQLRVAARDRSYWCLHAGFFTCGFHIAFLVTHLPGEVSLCALPASVAAGSLAIIGLSNVAGSLSIGWLGGIYRMKWLLFWVYLTRAVAIAVYLAMPRTPLVFYAFAAVLGFTWLSTVPPTAGLVSKLFGVRYLATLFGLTLLSHQIGGFFGAWLGGIALVRFGDYGWMWYADMLLASAAALINLPIRELAITPIVPGPATAR